MVRPWSGWGELATVLLVHLRVIFCLAMLFYGPAGGLASLGGDEQRCRQTCPDDDQKGECAPGCDDCTCCSHVRTLAVSPGAIHLPFLITAASVEAAERVLSPVPGDDILHVPKAG